MLYKGLSAGLLRQATYTTARLGIFSQISEYAKRANNGQNLPLWQKAACGLTAGGLGALVGTPADLTLIRMQVRAACHIRGGAGGQACAHARMALAQTCNPLSLHARMACLHGLGCTGWGVQAEGTCR